MGRSILLEALHKPLTSCISLGLTGVYLWLTSKGQGYAEVGASYERVVEQRQVWRLLTATFSHVELLHLLFNVSALWGLAGAEVVLGWRTYLRTTLLLVLTSAAVQLLLYYAFIHWARREHYRHVTSVGYSGVLFGWMAVIAVKNPGGMSRVPLLGLVTVPMALAPFGSLLLTTLIIPRASFVGHLAGILCGYTIGFGAFDWLSLRWALALVAWTCIGVVYAAVRRWLSLPFIHVQSEGDVESGLSSQLVRVLST